MHAVTDLFTKTEPAGMGEPTVRQFAEMPGVLVVDDEHLLRNMVQRGLERDGFNVWTASSGSEAIRLYRKHRDRIAVVLRDVRMPRLDGPQTLKALRKLNPAVRACFMSGDTGAYDAEELRQCGAACIVAKPFILEDLSNLLSQIAHGVPADLLLPVGRTRDQ
jgi:CheY-like chemotaxis protein